MNTYITLNKQIDANLLLNRIQELINRHGDTTDCILKIEICKITDNNNNLIPKLEYINE
jgi:hypothetical protein